MGGWDHHQQRVLQVCTALLTLLFHFLNAQSGPVLNPKRKQES